MSEWKEYKLGELMEITSSKRIFYSEYVSSGVPFYRSKEIIELFNGRNVTTELYISEEKYNSIKVQFGVPQEGDVLLTSVGSLGIPYKVMSNDRFYFKDGNLTWFRNIDANRIDTDYLIHWLTSNIGKQKLDEITIGSTQAALTISGLKTIAIKLPPIEEQRRIAGVLSSLDDKIDLLNRENATLEALAETLFRHYFIENPNPDWEEGRVSDFGKVICGKTPSKKVAEYYGGNIPFIKIPDMHGNTFVFRSDDSLSERGKNSQKDKTLPIDSIMVSCIATVGLVSMNAYESHTNQQINSVVPSKASYRYYLYCWFRSMYDELNTMASGGTATLNLNTGDFSRIVIPIPDNTVIESFDSQVKPLFEKIKTNQQQIISLSSQRDTLLSRLMSGEAKVGEY